MKPKTQDSSPRAVIYTRVSREQQSENTSLAGQFEACKRKAKELGASVVSFFEETKSGGLYLTRGELQRALTVIESGEANILIVARLDRAGREVESLRDIRRRIEIAGARLVFADGMNFEQSAVGDLLHTQLSGFAEFERALIRERTMAGQENKARAGIMPTRSKSPYGYRLWLKNDWIKGECGAEDVGHYIIVEEQGKWIAPLFERVAEGTSLRGACAWLSQIGAPTCQGNPWNPATLLHIIRNPIYRGAPAWRKTRSLIEESRAAQGLCIRREVPRPESEHIYMEAPALISTQLWEAANEMLLKGREERSGPKDRRYLLTGILRCPRCGGRLYARTLVQHRGDKTYRLYNYRCANTTKRQAEAVATCDLPTMGGKTLEGFVIEALVELLGQPCLLQSARREFAAARKRENASRDDAGEVKRLRREIEEQRRREDEATSAEIEARLAGNDGGAFARFRLKAEEVRRGLEAQLSHIEVRLQSAEVGEESDLAPDAARLVESVLGDEEVGVEERSAILRSLIECIYPVVLADELRVSAHQMRKAGKSESEGVMGRAARFCGGCEIVLRRQGACHILTRKVVRLETARDKNKRATLRPVVETDLRIETASPFPANKGRHSPFDFE